MVIIKSSRFLPLAFALLSLCLSPPPAGAALPPIPRGVYNIANSNIHCPDDVLANPNLTAISVRYAWRDLAPTEGTYDWSFLDEEVANAAAAGKKVMLRIMTQDGKPDWVTTAVQHAGGKFFTFTAEGKTATIPVFWDPTYLAKKKAMIAAVGAHFTNNPAVAVVVASFANAGTEEWFVPHTATDINNWFAVGYTSDKLIDAGKQIIDATMTAFPNQYVALAVGTNGHMGHSTNLDPTGDYVARAAVDAANASWPGRLIVQMNSLSTFIPAAPGSDNSAWKLLWDNQPNVAGQMIGFCYGDTKYKVNNGVPIDPAVALKKSITSGVSYGMNYIEVYQADVKNLPSTISWAQSVLTGASNPDPTPTPTPSPTPTPPPVYLLNLSTRVHVWNNDQVMIGGFMITGDTPKSVVIRALGPSLASQGVKGVLADPVLELHDSSGVVIAQNDNYVTPLPDDVVASGLTPPNPAESLIAITLAPGSYTAELRGANGATGVALCELYDTDPGNSRMTNMSTRGQVGTGDDVMIGGFIIGGSQPTKVIVRAIGPSLTQAGVQGALSDPSLELRDSQGSLIFSNDNWRSDQAQQIIDSTIPPSDNRESAIVATLPPGNYTATVRGARNTTGVALIEAYSLQGK